MVFNELPLWCSFYQPLELLQLTNRELVDARSLAAVALVALKAALLPEEGPVAAIVQVGHLQDLEQLFAGTEDPRISRVSHVETLDRNRTGLFRNIGSGQLVHLVGGLAVPEDRLFSRREVVDWNKDMKVFLHLEII